MPTTETLGLIVLIPLVGAGASFLFSSPRLRGWLPPTVLALSLAVVAALVIRAGLTLPDDGHWRTVVGGWAPALGIHLQLDAARLAVLLTVFAVAIALLISAAGERSYGSVFYGVFGIAISGMTGVVLSADLFNLFVFFEVLSLSAAVLIACKRNLAALYAAYKYLLVTVLSVALYLVGVFLLYRACGELAFARVADAIRSGAVPIDTARLSGGLLFSGIAIRVALVPFHAWLPDAHGQAPHPISALLSGLVLKAGFLALWRVVQIFPAELLFAEALRVLGLLSSVWGVGVALCQHDVKRLLAYHSISQMGTIAAAAGAGAWLGAVYHTFGHALFKSLLFLAVGTFVTRAGTRDLHGIAHARRPGRRDALPALCFLAGAAAIAGVPPFTGFVSKVLIGQALAGSVDDWILKGVAVGTAASFFKLGAVAILPAAGFGRGSPVAAHEGAPTGIASRAGLAAMVALSLAVLVPGVFADRLIAFLDPGGVAAPVGGVFAFGAIGESLAVLVAGFLLFRLVWTAPMQRGLAKVASMRPGIDRALAMTAVGAVVIFWFTGRP